MSVISRAIAPPVHDSAVASVQPRSRRASVTISAIGASSVANTHSPSSRRIAAANSLAGRLGAWIGADVDLDLEPPGTDRRLHAGRVASQIGEHVGHVRLADAVGADQRARSRARRGQTAAAAGDGQGRAATAGAAPTARRGARRSPRRRSQHQPRSSAGQSQHRCTARYMRLLEVAGGEPLGVEPVALGNLHPSTG